MANSKNPAVTEWATEIGRRGGKARLTKMTAEDRTRIARLAAHARWKKPTNPSGPNGGEELNNGGNVDPLPVIGHRRFPRRKSVVSVSANQFARVAA